jgi:hypothetical protein
VAELQGGTLAVGGTGGNDLFVLTPGATAGSLLVTLNGVNQGTFTPASGVALYGGDGTDTVVVNGTTAADAFGLSGTTATFNGLTIANHDIEALTLNGTAGSNGNDTFTVSNAQINTTLNGGAGDDSFTLSGTTLGPGVLTINGGANTAGIGDTLTAADVVNAWNLTAANGGTLDGFAFSSIENLNGGALGDTFTFQPAGSVSYKVDGKGGTDTFDYGPRSTAIAMNLQAKTATSVGSWDNVEAVIGSSATTDALTGADTANTWTVSAANAGDVNGTFSFTGVETLNGGANNDVFHLANDVAAVGKIDGKAGTDTLDYTGRTTAVAVDLAAKTATGLTASWVSLEAFVGSAAGTDTLTGANTANTWSLTGADAGTVGTIAFASFENLTGGTGADTFVFGASGSVSGTIDGKGGTDKLDFSGCAGPITINVQGKTATLVGGTWASIESVVGTAAADTLIGANQANTWNITANNGGNLNGAAAFAFVSFENLVGGTGADTFKFSNARSVSGSVNGGGGADTLDYSAFTTGVKVNLARGQMTANGVTAAVSNILNVTGGSAADLLVGDGANNTLIGNGGNNVLIGGGGADTLTGGAGQDLLIAGTTSYDSIAAALDAIYASWSGAGTYASRVAALRAGVSYSGGTAVLDATTVFDDAATDVLTGGTGTDWFFYHYAGSVLDTADWTAAEQRTAI